MFEPNTSLVTDPGSIAATTAMAGGDSASIFDLHESQVRSYSRQWPAVFDTAQGSWLTDEHGRRYLDFFAGAGALNYGHNNPVLKQALIDYIARDGITHALDMSTVAKRSFLETFATKILQPRGLDYKVQFPGPTGTNAVEAALKLARKVTGRSAVINFTNAFHGMTLGSLAVTGNATKRAGAGVPLVHATPMPFDNYFGGVAGDFQWLESVLDDAGSGINKPAAVIVETIQGEGGVNVARPEWLQGLAKILKARDILLIVDDVQMGAGRTGPFFSFEDAGIVPDIVTLSKSIGGYGMPMALTLMRPELDVWGPGEHNGTFRGNSPAFVTSAAAIDHYWTDGDFEAATRTKGRRIENAFTELTARMNGVSTRGRGMVHGLVFADPERASALSREAYRSGLLIETSGPRDEVVKAMPALTMSTSDLDHGLDILTSAAGRC